MITSICFCLWFCALNSYISLADRARPGSGARGLPSRHVDVGQRNRKRSLPFGQRTTPPDSSTPLRWGRACSHCCMGLTTLLPTMPLSWDWTGFSGTSGRVRSYEPQIIGRLTCVPVAVEVAVLEVPSPPDLYSACTREI